MYLLQIPDGDGYRVLEVASRIDLAPTRPIPEGVVGVSAICGTGLDALRAAIEDRLNAGTSASVESALRLLPSPSCRAQHGTKCPRCVVGDDPNR